MLKAAAPGSRELRLRMRVSSRIANAGQKGRVALLGLLVTSAVLLIAWSVAVPIFEAPDESHHWKYARYLHDFGHLPIYGPDFLEANSPPLYYMLVAPLAVDGELPTLIVSRDAQGHLQSPLPPRFYEDQNGDVANFLPLRWARLLTAGMSVLAVLFCYFTGLEATGERRTGLLAGSLMAFLPQFTFRGMNISNDALVTLMSAVAVYLTVRLIRRGFTWRLGLATAVTIGLALLSKPTSLFLAAPCALAVLSERASWRARLAHLSVLGVALLVALPWLVRNQMYYGDPLASRAMLTAVPSLVDPKPISSPYFLVTFPADLAMSFVGVFGWMNLWPPKALYGCYAFIGVLAISGYAWRWFRRRSDGRLTLILATVPLLNLLVVVYINLTFSQPQGRYMFPALSTIAVLGAIGLAGLPGWKREMAYTLAVILLLGNLYVLAFIIVPAYWTLPSWLCWVSEGGCWVLRMTSLGVG